MDLVVSFLVCKVCIFLVNKTLSSTSVSSLPDCLVPDSPVYSKGVFLSRGFQVKNSALKHQEPEEYAGKCFFSVV